MRRMNKSSRIKKKGFQIKRRRFCICLFHIHYSRSVLCFDFIVLKGVDLCVDLQLQRRMKIAELKQLCSRPDVVEVCYNCFLSLLGCLSFHLQIYIGFTIFSINFFCNFKIPLLQCSSIAFLSVISVICVFFTSFIFFSVFSMIRRVEDIALACMH